MKKKNYQVLLLLFFFAVTGCNKQKSLSMNLEGAQLIIPAPVTDQDMIAIQEIGNYVESQRKIGILLGYGYNDAAFVEATLEEIHRTLGLAEQGGAVIPYIYPQDFMRGGTARISALSDMLEEDGVHGLVVVGAPEGTHRVLAALQNTELNRALYPVISLMPQDDILGIESGSDIVIEYVPVSATVEGELVAESGTYQENVPQLIARSAYYLTLLPAEYFGGFPQDLDLLTHARQMAGSSWIVSRYIDPETGLCPMNHFVIDRRQG